MKLEIFAVRDRQLDAFMQPWCAQSIGQAIRMFTDEVNNQQGQMYKHAEDYDLYHMGTFFQGTGNLKQDEHQPKQVAIGANAKEAK